MVSGAKVGAWVRRLRGNDISIYSARGGCSIFMIDSAKGGCTILVIGSVKVGKVGKVGKV